MVRFSVALALVESSAVSPHPTLCPEGRGESARCPPPGTGSGGDSRLTPALACASGYCASSCLPGPGPLTLPSPRRGEGIAVLRSVVVDVFDFQGVLLDEVATGL